MLDWRWVSGAVTLLSACWLGASAPSPALPVLSRTAARDLAPLEAYVASHPDDAQALTRLTNAYLESAQPGLAEAALERAPAPVRREPRVADARARTLSYLGQPRLALFVQRSMLARCNQVQCSRTLTAHAAQRAGWLAELVRMGVRDPARQPRLAMVAYRRSVREVALDVR
jgi:hypothetical protein